MKFPIRLAPRARRDLGRLADFLSPKGPAAEAKAKAVIWRGVRTLEDFPERGSWNSAAGARELQVRFGRNGYVVMYVLEGDTVIVVRIFHSLEER